MVRSQTEGGGGVALTALKGEVDSKWLQKAARSAWISKDTWQLADRRPALQREGRVIKSEVSKVWSDFQCALQADRRRRVQAAGTSIEGLLEEGRVK